MWSDRDVGSRGRGARWSKGRLGRTGYLPRIVVRLAELRIRSYNATDQRLPRGRIQEAVTTSQWNVRQLAQGQPVPGIGNSNGSSPLWKIDKHKRRISTRGEPTIKTERTGGERRGGGEDE